MTWEAYLQTSDGIDRVASILLKLLNLAPTNPTPGREEKRRESANWGGTYYLFEVLGLELRLIANEGELGIPEMASAPICLVVQSEGNGVAETFARQIAWRLREAGIPCDVDSLT